MMQRITTSLYSSVLFAVLCIGAASELCAMTPIPEPGESKQSSPLSPPQLSYDSFGSSSGSHSDSDSGSHSGFGFGDETSDQQRVKKEEEEIKRIVTRIEREEYRAYRPKAGLNKGGGAGGFSGEGWDEPGVLLLYLEALRNIYQGDPSGQIYSGIRGDIEKLRNFILNKDLTLFDRKVFQDTKSENLDTFKGLSDQKRADRIAKRRQQEQDAFDKREREKQRDRREWRRQRRKRVRKLTKEEQEKVDSIRNTMGETVRKASVALGESEYDLKYSPHALSNTLVKMYNLFAKRRSGSLLNEDLDWMNRLVKKYGGLLGGTACDINAYLKRNGFRQASESDDDGEIMFRTLPPVQRPGYPTGQQGASKGARRPSSEMSEMQIDRLAASLPAFTSGTSTVWSAKSQQQKKPEKTDMTGWVEAQDQELDAEAKAGVEWAKSQERKQESAEPVVSPAPQKHIARMPVERKQEEPVISRAAKHEPDTQAHPVLVNTPSQNKKPVHTYNNGKIAALGAAGVGTGGLIAWLIYDHKKRGKYSMWSAFKQLWKRKQQSVATPAAA